MEEDNNQISKVENKEHTDNSLKGLKRNFFLLLIIGILILIIVSIAIRSYLPKKGQDQVIKNNQPSISISPSSSSKSQINLDNFFLFAIPKSIKNLTVYDLPNYAHPESVLTVDDNLWLTGNGTDRIQSVYIASSIVEYDTKSGEVVTYSDPRKADCDDNMVFVAGYLFTNCYIYNNEAPRSGLERREGGYYGILKINPKTHEVKYIDSGGPNLELTADNIRTDFIEGKEAEQIPPNKNFRIIYQLGLTQLSDSNKIYQLDGRINLDLSPMIGNKRYILTNATIDMIDDDTPFSKILIKLGEQVRVPEPGLARLFIDPETLFGIALASFCSGPTCEDWRRIWLIDFNSGKIIKTYTESDRVPYAPSENFWPPDLIMVREDDILIVKNKNNGETVFTINTKNYNLTVPVSPTP